MSALTLEPAVEPTTVENAFTQPAEAEVEAEVEVVLEDNDGDEAKALPPKKRGRKPKGGKIIVNNVAIDANPTPEPNIVMHLKCGLADLNEFISKQPSSIDAFQFNQFNGNNLGFQLLQQETPLPKGQDQEQDEPNTVYNNDMTIISNNNNTTTSSVKAPTDELRVIWQKLKDLAYLLHNNNVDKKSACFWCTFDFDSPPIFIPKYELNNKYYCYGCFCSPECATAFLFKETIDSSARFERYHMLNHIYSKIYAYQKNIKPAPDPYYTLNKYYGNLTIQEYRRLLKNERLLLVVDKPLCRTLPELHEDADDLMFTGKTIPPASNFKLRRNVKQSKNDILQNQFNGGAS